MLNLHSADIKYGQKLNWIDLLANNIEANMF